jgi:hypothetical protein
MSCSEQLPKLSASVTPNRIGESRSACFQVEGLPSLVNAQWKGEAVEQVQSNGQSSNPGVPSAELDSELYQQELQYLGAMCPEYRCSALQPAEDCRDRFCGAYVVESSNVCRRVNTMQGLLTVNREMAEMSHAGTAGVCREKMYLFQRCMSWRATMPWPICCGNIASILRHRLSR